LVKQPEKKGVNLTRSQALKLPIGTKMRGVLYIDDYWSYGEVVESPYHGKGVRFDDYNYIDDDCHGFYNMSGRLLESLEVVT